MTSQIAFLSIALLFSQNLIGGFAYQGAARKPKASDFSFADTQYSHRYTKDDQHEYTPQGQEDLNAWTEMVTLLVYRRVKDGDGLAATANAVLENYKANKAVVVKTNSVPRTREKPAEHLVVVIFPRPDFLEAAFTRFRLHDGAGSAVVFSHRIYGKKAGDAMSAWLEKNGSTIEGVLMKWDSVPKPLPQG